MRFCLVTALLVVAMVSMHNRAWAGMTPASFIEGITREGERAAREQKGFEADQVFLDHFGMPAFSQRCLVDHWGELTEEQRDRFVDLFTCAMRKKVGSSLRRAHTGKDVSSVVGNPRKKDGRIVEVPVTLQVQGRSFALLYTLVPEGRSYQIVDYQVEGALLSRQYRGQFNFLMRKYGFDGMLEKMRENDAACASGHYAKAPDHL